MKLKVLKPTSRSTEEWRDIPGYEGRFVAHVAARVQDIEVSSADVVDE